MRLVLALVAITSVAACQKTETSSQAANCARVAETLASFEMGTASTPDKRTPVVAKHRAACESAKVTAEQATCLRGATDTWTARACLSTMFPAAGTTGTGAGCAMFAARMRDAVMSEVGSQGSAASAAVDKMAPVIEQACEQDKWPAAVLDCVARTKPGDMTAFQTCANQLPKDMQEKLAQKLMAQQQQLEQTAPTAPTAPAPTAPTAPAPTAPTAPAPTAPTAPTPTAPPTKTAPPAK